MEPKTVVKRSACSKALIAMLALLVAIAVAVGVYFGVRISKSNQSASQSSGGRAPPEEPSRPPLNKSPALLEPPSGRTFLGFHLNWKIEQPAALIAKIGDRRPAVFNAFLEINNIASPNFPYDSGLLRWHGQQVGRFGGILQLTIQPLAIATLQQTVIDTLADQCRDINREFKVPILLRYGHEMNGPWGSHGMKPSLFVNSFIQMANAIKSRTNLTGKYGPLVRPLIISLYLSFQL